MRDLTWTSYDRVKTVIEAGRTLTFAYGATRERFRQIDSGGPTTLYVDGLYEREALGALTTHVHHVFAGGQAVAIYKSRSDSTEDLLYLHRDHLGSVTQLTRVTGGTPTVVESLAYDPWGKRRNSNWLDSTTATGTNTKRGYTGHEHLDPATLVHMNGRVYDPSLAQMLSPDPLVQAPGYSQSFNRYSYAMNSSLTHTDPSGYATAFGGHGFAPFVGGLGGQLGGQRGGGGVTTTAHYGQTATWVRSGFGLPGLARDSLDYIAGIIGQSSGSRACIVQSSCQRDGILNFTGEGGFGEVGFASLSFMGAFGGAYMIVQPIVYYIAGPPTYAAFASVGAEGQGFFGRLWGRFSGALMPTTTALGARGVPGSFADNSVGYMKAAYNTSIDYAAAYAGWPWGNIIRAVVPHAQIADNQLLGAALYEQGSLVAGTVLGGRTVTRVASAARAAAPTGQFYSVAAQTRLGSSSFPGVSRARHFQEANENLLRAMEADASYAQMLQQGGINLQRTATGLAPRTPPSGWTWHHAPESGVMQLVPRSQHTPGSIFWDSLHPGGRGGYSIWGQ